MVFLHFVFSLDPYIDLPHLERSPSTLYSFTCNFYIMSRAILERAHIYPDRLQSVHALEMATLTAEISC